MKIVIIVMILTLFIGIIDATPLVWHSANVLKTKSFLFQTNFSYTKTSYRYDYNTNSWQILSSNTATTTFSPELMLGYGVFNNFEIKIAIPIAYKSKASDRSFGFGDVMIKTRYNLINRKSILFTIAGAMTLPTSPTTANPLIDDHTLDIAFGGYLFTKEYKRFTSDFRFGYFYNGTNNNIKIGNLFEYFIKFDYKLTPGLIPYVSFFGTIQAKNKNLANNLLVPNSERVRHNFQLGGVYKISNELTLRVRIIKPLKIISKGGEIPNYSFGIDFWFIK